MQKYIYTKFYNNILKEASLEEIKGIKPIGGGVVWWLAPLISTVASSANQPNANDKPIGFPQSPHFGQASDFQMPTNIYGQQPSNNGSNGLSSDLMGDYNSKPKYGPQDNANPWQEQLMSQLFQQQDTQRSQNEPTAMKGGGGGGGK